MISGFSGWVTFDDGVEKKSADERMLQWKEEKQIKERRERERKLMTWHAY